MRSTLLRFVRTLTIGAAVALLGAACVGTLAPGASDQGRQRATAILPAGGELTADDGAAAADRCVEAVGQTSRLTNSVKDESTMADAVVIGTVLNPGKARWATADGKEPRLAEDQLPTVNMVFRPVTIRIDAVGRVGPNGKSYVQKGGTIVVQVKGGTIGCSSYLLSDWPLFARGESVAMFLKLNEPVSRANGGGDFVVVDPWPIRGGRVLQPWGAVLAPDDFVRQSVSAE